MDLLRPRPDALPGPVRRPDGTLQLGLGPGAWLVEGWGPERSLHDPASVLVRGLVEPVAGPRPDPVAYAVLGDGELAMRLRAVAREQEQPETGGTVAPSGSLPAHVVLVSAHLVPVGTARRADLAGRCVLPVVLQSGRIVVGPWTGQPGSACLHCLDLHRRDRDQAWPAVAAAFDDPSCRADPPAHPDLVLDLAQALVLLLVGSVGSGGPAAVGALSYEVGERPPHLVTRGWTAHPACPWHTG